MTPRFIRILVVTGLALALIASRALADIAPTAFVGYGISPVEARGLHMVSAQVDLVWGRPCALTATFVIGNEISKPAEIHLGFPIVMDSDWSLFHVPSKVPDDINFAFNGTSIPNSDITIDTQPATPGKPFGSKWYRCLHTFPPGQTKVTFKANLPPSLDYEFNYREHLYYCIETGGFWEGPIGSEEVDIHFPDPIAEGEIIEANPAGYTVKDNTIQWRFKDFKPKGQDYDVDITYLRPDVLPTLAHVRAELARDPSNPALILKLVKDLIALGPRKNYDLPCPYVDEAKPLMEKLLKDHPTDADAWSVYILDYGRFYPGTRADFSTHLIETLKKAAALCPQDAYLQLQYKIDTQPYPVSTDPRHPSDEDPRAVALEQEIEKRGFRDNDYPKIKYGYW